jgi:hypothetical protein
MTTTVGDYFIERLHQWGVRRIYGYPGDGINGVFGALQRAKGKIEFIQCRHEEMAAFMASAHAKFTGELGVCIATSGPGASHLVTGLYDARLDHMAVLAIAGQQARGAMGGHYQPEVDLPSLLKDVAGSLVQTVTVPSQVRHLTDRAVRIALSERRVTGSSAACLGGPVRQRYRALSGAHFITRPTEKPVFADWPPPPSSCGTARYSVICASSESSVRRARGERCARGFLREGHRRNHVQVPL